MGLLPVHPVSWQVLVASPTSSNPTSHEKKAREPIVVFSVRLTFPFTGLWISVDPQSKTGRGMIKFM